MATLLYIPQYKQTVLNVPGGITSGQTTGIILSNTDNIDITKPGLVCLTYADPLDTDTAEFITYTSIDANKELQGVSRAQEGISAKAHLNNAQVAFVVSKSHINRINDKLTGVDTTVIVDTNGNEILTVSQVSSAVNYVNLKNSATGNGPEVQALGDNTNIDLILVPKGTGDVAIYVPTGNDATLIAKGADTDVDLSLSPKGAGKVNVLLNDLNLATGANIQVADADPWRTVTLNAGVFKPTTTSPCADSAKVEAGTNDIDYDVLAFDASSDENAYCNFQMPESYDGGVIQFRYVWTNAGGGSAETVVFELSGRAYADSDAIDQAVGTPIEVSDTWLAQNDIHISAWSGDVTLAGSPAGSQWVHLEVMRDVSEDNLTGDARLIAVQIRFKQKQYSD